MDYINKNSNEVIPRPEYPRPQFFRNTWKNLNGEWTFEFDFGKSGYDRKLTTSKGFKRKIIIPFCPESELSGVNHKDFIEMMWYHRNIKVSNHWQDKKIILHFGAVDFEAEVFIDGEFVGKHIGGSCSFYFDITNFVEIGNMHNLVVCVKDDTRSGLQPIGKQSFKYDSFECHYTRVTGIWQTVWLEAVSEYGIKNCNIVADIDNEKIHITPDFYSLQTGQKLNVTIYAKKQKIVEKIFGLCNDMRCELSIDNPILWSPENPFLYDIHLKLIDQDGTLLDHVETYCGMRKIHIKENKIFLNNKELYQRLVLDQGYYPDGIWTAPSDAALKRDILLSLNAGFNGARLHQKVFEERFHYWADKLGYLTWSESASWGLNIDNDTARKNFLNEWEEILRRDRNHPSIITWTPLNETIHFKDKKKHRSLHVNAYNLTKKLDPSRPVNDASGFVHVKTDIWTIHHYEQNAEKLTSILEQDKNGNLFRNYPEMEAEYSGQPYIIDEFGGIKWIHPKHHAFAENSWGYGDSPQSEQEYYERLKSLVQAILSLKHISGYCFTQLTDVEQEENGIYNYDRSEKFNMKIISEIFRNTIIV